MSTNGKVMNVSAQSYNDTNKYQMETAVDLINKIIADNKDRKLGTIVDIGCGSGNVTELLSRSLNADRIIALDIDPDMIAYARANQRQTNIEFVVQDFGVEWSQLSEELRTIESSVSLVFSNRALHWIRNTDNVATNIYRLLESNGKMYANITCVTDPFAYLPLEDRLVYERQILKIVSGDQQMNSWINAFERNGLTVIESEMNTKKQVFKWDDWTTTVMPFVVSGLKQYLPESDETSRQQKWKQFLPLMLELKLNEFKPFIDTLSNVKLVEVNLFYYYIIVTKDSV